MITVYIIVGAVVIFIIGLLWGIGLLDVVKGQMPGEPSHVQVIQKAIDLCTENKSAIEAINIAFSYLMVPLSDRVVINQIYAEVMVNDGGNYATWLEVLEAMLRRATND